MEHGWVNSNGQKLRISGKFSLTMCSLVYFSVVMDIKNNNNNNKEVKIIRSNAKLITTVLIVLVC